MLPSFEQLYQGIDWSTSVAALLLSSSIFIAVLLVLRLLLVRFIQRSIRSVDLRRRWLVQSRNGFLLLLLFGLVLIWGEALRTLALSLVAIAVAVVVATKELLMCLTGSILKSGAGAFSIGDRIQVKDFRGDVIDQSLLATTLLEVGPGRNGHQRTGRMTVIPNSLFVSEPVINESYTDNYVLHVFTVPFMRVDNWQAARHALLQAAERHCRDYLENARRHMQKLNERQGLSTPSVEPRISIQVPMAEEVHLVVRIPARSSERGMIEQAILNDVFANEDFTASDDASSAPQQPAPQA